jgi:hypothetical protein
MKRFLAGWVLLAIGVLSVAQAAPDAPASAEPPAAQVEVRLERIRVLPTAWKDPGPELQELMREGQALGETADRMRILVVAAIARGRATAVETVTVALLEGEPGHFRSPAEGRRPAESLTVEVRRTPEGRRLRMQGTVDGQEVRRDVPMKPGFVVFWVQDPADNPSTLLYLRLRNLPE